MAVSALNSTSKRGNLGTCSNNTSPGKESNSENLSKKAPHRRSRSVSALSRYHLEISSSSQSSSVVDFLNKRDNPLFCSSSPASPPDATESENVQGISKLDENASQLSKTATRSVGSSASESRRARSVSRHSDYGDQLSGIRKEMGRSLSRVDMGRRRRSVSRSHYGNAESEVEQEYSLSSGSRQKNNVNFTPNLVVTRASELSDQTRTLQRWSSQHPPLESSDGSYFLQTSNWEDGVSTSSFSEAEEKTIKAVFEQMKNDHPAGDSSTGRIFETVRSEVRLAISEIQNDIENAIRRKNPTIIGTTNVVDIPPELVNPDAVELVSDIRREYARKLEQSQERARKLRADLAVEEHRVQEFSRILKEILPDPKTSGMQKSRPRRKTSIERRKMSKRLTEEAMNFFDECVSISTFDSSDFSSPEDPPLNLVAAASPVGDCRMLPCGSSNASTFYCSDGRLKHNKESDSQVLCIDSNEASVLTVSSCSNEPTKDQGSQEAIDTERIENFQFSFSREPREILGLHHDIKNYIKRFEKDIHKDDRDCQIARLSYYDADDYALHVLAESLLFDRVILKNRINSGSLLLCASGVAI